MHRKQKHYRCGFRSNEKSAKVDSVVDILMATIDIMGDELSYYIRKEYPGYYIYPNIQGVGYKDFNRILEIVEYGEKVAEKELQNIMNFYHCEKFSI